MLLQKQPTRWSCLPTAFAMAMNKPVVEIFKAIGHDGSEILFPALEEPQNRRAFHIAECIRAAYMAGYAVTQFEVHPILSPDGIHTVDFEIIPPFKMTSFGVATGRPLGKFLRHAVAFEGTTAYDPNGKQFDLRNQFRVDCYFVFDLIL